MKKTPVYFNTSNKKLNLNQVKNEMLEKYGRLDWSPTEGDNEKNEEEGKRYVGLPILMNLESGHILSCNVILVDDEGFLVEPLSVSGLADSEPDVDFDKVIPYEKFYHVFLRA